MKHGYFKKTISITAAVALSLNLLSACSSKNLSGQNPASGTTVQNTASTAATGTSEAGARGPLGKYVPSIDISFVRGIDDDFASNVIPNCPGETVENNRWFDVYRKELGINIIYDWTVRGNEDSDAYSQKITVTLASGNLPDVVNVNAFQLRQLADNGMITDLTPYWNEYATPMLKEYYKQQGSSVLDCSNINGKLMALTVAPDVYGDGVYTWIRSDWLGKLGLKPPKSMSDVLEICRAFTISDPDGNGQNDTYGLAATKDLYSGSTGLEGFFAGYHAYPNMWIEDSSGKLAWGSIQPEVRHTLQVLAEMYKAGEIDPEFAVKDMIKAAETIASGRIGLEYGAQWNPMYPLISDYRNNPNADWTGYPLVSADSSKVYSPAKFGAIHFFVVRKGYEHPEALIKLMNMHVEKCWGNTADFNKYYMPAENRSIGVWKFSPVYPAPPSKNIEAMKALNEARRTDTLGNLTGEAATIERNIKAFDNGDKTQWGWMKIYGPEGVYQWGLQYFADGQFYKEKFTGAPTKTMVNKKPALDQMEKEEFIKIIMGEAPISEFDNFVSDWNKLGGKDITRDVNLWYESVKGKS
ncbi:MAG TPA: extracellular solute-binding protein [Clostridia bacterium]|nr:extracellular solute-binding protein [Clostridia bacterium]